MTQLAYPELEAREVIEGWDTAQGYLLVKGQLGLAARADPTRTGTAWMTLAAIYQAVAEGLLKVTVFGRVEESVWWRGGVLPVTCTQAVSAELLEVVDRLHPDGGWCHGTYPGQRKPSLTVVKVAPSGEPVALIACCPRNGV